MRVHKFKAKLKGWGNEYDIIWFDADRYSKEEAESQIIEKTGVTEKNGREYMYTYYEYGGVEYYSYVYLGIEDR